MTEATLRLMQMPQNPEMEHVIHLAKNVVEQLKRQNPLSSHHGTRSRATATVIPQASRTPGSHHRQQQLEQQNQRNQEDQEVASIHSPWVVNHQQTKLLGLNRIATTIAAKIGRK